MFLKRSMFTALLPLLFIGMLLAACGSTATGGGGNTPAATTAPTATPTTAAAPVVMTASATVDGKSVTILTDAKGMTLYYYKPDTATTTACTGGCATNWPPLTFSGSGQPTASSTLPGTLSVVTSADGAQVQYQKHFLYTFIGDKKAGDVNGQGKGGVWFAATTDLAALSSGYGY